MNFKELVEKAVMIENSSETKGTLSNTVNNLETGKD